MQEITNCYPPPDAKAQMEKDHPHSQRVVLYHLQQLSGKEAQQLQPQRQPRPIHARDKRETLQEARRYLPAMWGISRHQRHGDSSCFALVTIPRTTRQQTQHAVVVSPLPQRDSLQPLAKHPTDARQGRRIRY